MKSAAVRIAGFRRLKTSAVREPPKTNLPVARMRDPGASRLSFWGQRLSHVHPFARMYIPRHYVRDRVASSTSAARLCWLPGTTHAISRRLAAGLGHHAGQEHPRSIEQLSSVNLGEVGVGIGPILIISITIKPSQIALSNVRGWANSVRHLLDSSSSGFDPKPTY